MLVGLVEHTATLSFLGHKLSERLGSWKTKKQEFHRGRTREGQREEPDERGEMAGFQMTLSSFRLNDGLPICPFHRRGIGIQQEPGRFVFFLSHMFPGELPWRANPHS